MKLIWSIFQYSSNIILSPCNSLLLSPPCIQTTDLFFVIYVQLIATRVVYPGDDRHLTPAITVRLLFLDGQGWVGNASLLKPY